MNSRPDRRRILAVLLLGVAAVALSASAHAASCDSAASVAIDLWDEYGKFAKRAGCSVASTATVAASSVVGGGSKQVYRACLADTEAREKLVRQMVATWNRLAANRWATVGPRQLPLGTAQQGTLVGPGTRMFLTPAPLHVDAIDVALTKQAFRGPAEVTVCSYAPGGIKARRWNFTIESGGRNTGRTWLRRIVGVEGQLVSVHIVGQSAAKRLKYRLNVAAAVTRIRSAGSPARREAAPETVHARTRTRMAGDRSRAAHD
jgi:hypothetical protein